jgi:hypothetical protein
MEAARRAAVHRTAAEVRSPIGWETATFLFLPRDVAFLTGDHIPKERKSSVAAGGEGAISLAGVIRYPFVVVAVFIFWRGKCGKPAWRKFEILTRSGAGRTMDHLLPSAVVLVGSPRCTSSPLSGCGGPLAFHRRAPILTFPPITSRTIWLTPFRNDISSTGTRR